MERYLQIKGEQNSPIFFPSHERGRNEHTERCTAKEEVGVEGLTQGLDHVGQPKPNACLQRAQRQVMLGRGSRWCSRALCWDQKLDVILFNKTGLSARNRRWVGWFYYYCYFFYVYKVYFYCLAEIVCC